MRWGYGISMGVYGPVEAQPVVSVQDNRPESEDQVQG
jgi:hypothetical protein